MINVLYLTCLLIFDSGIGKSCRKSAIYLTCSCLNSGTEKPCPKPSHRTEQVFSKFPRCILSSCRSVICRLKALDKMLPSPPPTLNVPVDASFKDRLNFLIGRRFSILNPLRPDTLPESWHYKLLKTPYGQIAFSSSRQAKPAA